MANNLAFAVVGPAGSGKSSGLRNIPNQSEWLYLNCETNKPLPFAHKFNEQIVRSPKDLGRLITVGANSDKCKGIIVDTLTSAFDMQEMTSKRTAEDKYQVWDTYRDFIMNLFQGPIANCNKPIIFLCHVEQVKDARGRPVMAISVKGSTANRGIESFFTNIVYADCLDVLELEEYKNDYLTISDDEKEDEVKYVYQTRKAGSGGTLNIRSTVNMWSRNESFIDNDVMHIINKIKSHYGEK